MCRGGRPQERTDACYHLISADGTDLAVIRASFQAGQHLVCSTHELDKAALQAALTKLGKTSDPDTATLATKRQQDFDALIALANAQYRTALVSTNQKDTEKATQAAVALAQYWKDLSDLYSTTAPQVFATDTAWSGDLAQIVKTVNVAKDAIVKGDLVAGHAALEPVREILLQVRTRNQVQVYGDKLTIFHAAM